jgi:hypothetical protein
MFRSNVALPNTAFERTSLAPGFFLAILDLAYPLRRRNCAT